MLNQILEFHGIIQSQLGRLATVKDFLERQRDDLNRNDPGNGDVDLYADVVQTTFQVNKHTSTPGSPCELIRNLCGVLIA